MKLGRVKMDLSGFGSSEKMSRMKMKVEAISGRTLMCAVCAATAPPLHFLQNWPQLLSNLAKTIEIYWTTTVQKFWCESYLN